MSKAIVIEEKAPRKFLGKTSSFLNKKERNSEKKHLKAYLRGNKYWANGFFDLKQGKFPNWELVKQENQYRSKNNLKTKKNV